MFVFLVLMLFYAYKNYSEYRKKHPGMILYCGTLWHFSSTVFPVFGLSITLILLLTAKDRSMRLKLGGRET